MAGNAGELIIVPNPDSFFEEEYKIPNWVIELTKPSEKFVKDVAQALEVPTLGVATMYLIAGVLYYRNHLFEIDANVPVLYPAVCAEISNRLLNIHENNQSILNSVNMITAFLYGIVEPDDFLDLFAGPYLITITPAFLRARIDSHVISPMESISDAFIGSYDEPGILLAILKYVLPNFDEISDEQRVNFLKAIGCDPMRDKRDRDITLVTLNALREIYKARADYGMNISAPSGKQIQ